MSAFLSVACAGCRPAVTGMMEAAVLPVSRCGINVLVNVNIQPVPGVCTSLLSLTPFRLLFVDGHDVELWRTAVKLGTLHHTLKTAGAGLPSANVVAFRKK